MAEDMGSLRPWSNLPRDLLLIFLDHLGFADHVRFGAVCKGWGTAAACHRRKKLLWLPWLALPANKEKPLLTLLSPVEAQTYDIHLPAPLSPECQGSLLVGSSHGWLTVFEYYQDHPRVRLMNPFTEKAIELPYHPLEYIKTTFHKAIILSPTDASDSNCVVVAILGDRSVAFCRPRDNAWTSLDVDDSCKDIAICRGLLYYLMSSGEITIFEIGDEEVIRKGFHNPGSSFDDIGNACSLFLVGSGSRVLLVACTYVYDHTDGCSCMVDEDDEDNYEGSHNGEGDGNELCKCRVLFKLFEMNERSSQWNAMKELKDEVLFVSGGDSILMNASNWPSLRGNCICFADDCYGELELDWGVFSLDDGSVIKSRMDNSMPLRGPAMWVRLNGLFEMVEYLFFF